MCYDANEAKHYESSFPRRFVFSAPHRAARCPRSSLGLSVSLPFFSSYSPSSPPSHRSFCFVLHHLLRTPPRPLTPTSPHAAPTHSPLLRVKHNSARAVSLCAVHPSRVCPFPTALIYHRCRRLLSAPSSPYPPSPPQHQRLAGLLLRSQNDVCPRKLQNRHRSRRRAGELILTFSLMGSSRAGCPCCLSTRR